MYRAFLLRVWHQRGGRVRASVEDVDTGATRQETIVLGTHPDDGGASRRRMGTRSCSMAGSRPRMATTDPRRSACRASQSIAKTSPDLV